MADNEIKLGDIVECMVYGSLIRGTVVELGEWTGRPIKMRRHDNNKFHAIIGRENCRKVVKGDGSSTCLECGEPLADDCRFDTCGKHGRDQFVDTVMKGKG